MDEASVVRAVVEVTSVSLRDASLPEIITFLRQVHPEEDVEGRRYGTRVQTFLSSAARQRFVILRDGAYRPTDAGRQHIAVAPQAVQAVEVDNHDNQEEVMIDLPEPTHEVETDIGEDDTETAEFRPGENVGVSTEVRENLESESEAVEEVKVEENIPASSEVSCLIQETEAIEADQECKEEKKVAESSEVAEVSPETLEEAMEEETSTENEASASTPSLKENIWKWFFPDP